MPPKYLSLLILLFFLILPPSYAAEAQIKPLPSDPAVQEFVRLVNAKRRSVGCPELKWDGRVAAIASAHSADMVSRNFFSHTNPDGKSPFDRLQEANVAFSAAAENIALGPTTGQEAYDTWMRSPEHRKNMLDCRFTRHAVGRVGDRWTHVLFRPYRFESDMTLVSVLVGPHLCGSFEWQPLRGFFSVEVFFLDKNLWL